MATFVRAAQQINARELLTPVFTTVMCWLKKWVIVDTLAHPQSRDFKRWAGHPERILPNEIAYTAQPQMPNKTTNARLAGES